MPYYFFYRLCNIIDYVMMMTDHGATMIIGNRCTCGSTQNGHEVCAAMHCNNNNIIIALIFPYRYLSIAQLISAVLNKEVFM